MDAPRIDCPITARLNRELDSLFPQLRSDPQSQTITHEPSASSAIASQISHSSRGPVHHEP
jgi:hypothetical protein